MTRVEFYVLSADSRQQRVSLVCHLAEKATRRRELVHIHTDDTSLAADIDHALWQFREDSFIAHQPLTTPPQSLSPSEIPVFRVGAEQPADSHRNSAPVLDTVREGLSDLVADGLAKDNFTTDNSTADGNSGSVVLDSDPPTALAPVTVGCNQLPGIDRTFLINLASEVPAFFSRFRQTIEIVDQRESIREQARHRYQFYQQRGYPLQHHNL